MTTPHQEFELSDQKPLKKFEETNKSDHDPEVLPFFLQKNEFDNNKTDLNNHHNNNERSRGKELWKKASSKIISMARVNNLSKFINNVYYGIGIAEQEFEETTDEDTGWV